MQPNASTSTVKVKEGIQNPLLDQKLLAVQRAQEERAALALERQQLLLARKRLRGLVTLGLGLGLASSFLGGVPTFVALVGGMLKGAGGGAAAGAMVNIASTPPVLSPDRRRELSASIVTTHWNTLIELGLVTVVQQGPYRYKDARGVKYNLNVEGIAQFTRLCRDWLYINKEKEPGDWDPLEGDDVLVLSVNSLLDSAPNLEVIKDLLQEIESNPEYVVPTNIERFNAFLAAVLGSPSLAGHPEEAALIEQYQKALAGTQLVDRVSLRQRTKDLERQVQNLQSECDQRASQMEQNLKQEKETHRQEIGSIKQQLEQLTYHVLALQAGQVQPAMGMVVPQVSIEPGGQPTPFVPHYQKTIAQLKKPPQSRDDIEMRHEVSDSNSLFAPTRSPIQL